MPATSTKNYAFCPETSDANTIVNLTSDAGMEMWTVVEVNSTPVTEDQVTREVDRDDSQTNHSNNSVKEGSEESLSLSRPENTLEKNESSTAVPRATPNGLYFSTDYTDPDANVIANVTSVGNLKEQVTLEWRGVNVFVPQPRASCCRRLCGAKDSEEPGMKQILFDVSGRLDAGCLLAVMGSSGAGKSTLMNVLAHRNIGGIQVTGTVEVNGHHIGLDINSLSAYVQQEDLFIGTLTVREHLTFQALLRMDKHTSKERREERVNQVLLELGLNKCSDTVIGIPGRVRGISGGEQKRLSFASEVLTNPPLLFADEPTSGLDSFMAQSLVGSLKRLAASGHTIMCTIHQPSSEVYAMFDSILLVAEGRTAYMGSSTDAIPYFKQLGYPCPVNFNPADYFVHTLAIVPGDEEKSRKTVKEICDAYSDHEVKLAKKESLNTKNCFRDDVYFQKSSPYKASWCRQFGALLWRSWITNNRDALVFKIRIFTSIVTALIAGLIYLQIPYDQDGVQNIGGVLFFLITSTSFGSLQGVIFTFPVELPVFMREHKNGMYRTDVYFLAKTIAEIPIFLITPLLLMGISYFMIGLRSEVSSFFVCYAIMALVTMVAVSFGYVISTMAPTVTAAASLGPPLMLPLLIFGGFFLKSTTVPVYFVWLKYISWFLYGFEAAIINQWKDFSPIACGKHATSVSPGMNATGGGGLCIRNGNEAIDFLGFDKDKLLFDVYILIALLVGFRIIAFLFLLRRSYAKQ